MDGKDCSTHAALLDSLRARGADRIAHPGGTLLAHLLRTAQRLESWGASPVLMAAGLCHAAYGTQGLQAALFTLRERELLRLQIGDEAEAIVYAYCAWDRASDALTTGELRDRFSGEYTVASERLLRQLCELSVANELDVAEHAQLSECERAELTAFIRACESRLSHAAYAVVRSAPKLAAAFQAVRARAAVADCAIAHRELGTHGEQVLFWHGGATPELTWAKQHGLSASLRLRIPWRRGFAPSAAALRQDWEADARDLLRVMPGAVHVVGHSYGGLSALIAATIAPQRFKSLVLIEPAVPAIAQDDPDVKQLSSLARAFLDGAPEARVAFLAIAGLPEQHAQTARSERLAIGGRDPAEATLSYERLREACVPVAVVSGVHFRGIETICDALADTLQAQRWKLAGAGHAVQRHADFNAKLSAFIAHAAGAQTGLTLNE